MPESAAQPARRETLTGDAARRRAVTVLRLAEAVAGYAAGQLADGLSPEQARQAALDVAGELELVAARLRGLAGLAGLSTAERRVLTVRLVASGMSQRQAAERLGVSRRTIAVDLRQRAPFSGPPG